MKWRHKHVTMQLVINKSKLSFASRARFMLKHRERECIFLVYRMVWMKISVTKWTKTSQVTKSLWGNPVLREFSMKKSMSQIVLLRIIMSLGRPHTGHESWLLRWAFPIIKPPFFVKKVRLVVLEVTICYPKGHEKKKLKWFSQQTRN